MAILKGQRRRRARPVSCWFVDSDRAEARGLLAQYADACACEYRHYRSVSELPHRIPRGALIAISGSSLSTLGDTELVRLTSAVDSGATLYIRGVVTGRWAMRKVCMAALLDLRISPKAWAGSYGFTASELVPRALRHEAANAALEVCGAECVSPEVEVLVTARCLDGMERAIILTLPVGRGRVIYDLNSHWQDSDDPVVARLANPAERISVVGPLIALSAAMTNGTGRESVFNLTVDDRPTNHDYFSTITLRSWLRDVNNRCPGAHIDFAWTPRYGRPARAYVEAIKYAGGGFVWHGFLRHVDHTKIEEVEREIVLGERAVSDIERRCELRFQRIMIFPFERSRSDLLRVLRNHDFFASVEEPRDFMRGQAYCGSRLSHRTDERSGLTVLYRYPANVLTRDRLLAMAALGLPIIAYVHPDEVGLQRFSFLRTRDTKGTYLEEVLEFAREKHLRSCSLEQIAAQIRQGRPQRTTE